MNRTLTAALVPLAFMAGAAVGPGSASAVVPPERDPAAIYAPVSFTPSFPDGCRPVSGARTLDDLRSGQYREVVLYRLACGDAAHLVQRSVLRRGPWLAVTWSTPDHSLRGGVRHAEPVNN